jgi:homospermidine synthase
MNGELNNFLQDLIILIQEKFNQSLVEESNESESDRSYRLGVNYAYYDVLDTIESQIESFGFEKDKLNKITPTLGQKI